MTEQKNEDPKKVTVARTPVAGCDACEKGRLHTETDWARHKLNRHGYLKETGWTHPDLEKER